MMRNKALIFSYIFLLFFTIPAFSQGSDEERETRIHYLLNLENRSTAEYTSISHWKKTSDNYDFYFLTLLIDLGNNERWIYIHKTYYNGQLSPEKTEDTFLYLKTHETLKVLSKFLPKSDVIENYTFSASPKGTNFVLLFDKAKINPVDYLPFINQNFSANFLAGLERLRTFSLSAYNTHWYFELSPDLFRSFWGITPETEAFKPIDPNIIRYPQILNHNCDFDSQFGYPCKKKEVPAKNPKCLVINHK